MVRPQTRQITSCHVINACRAFGLVNCGAEKGCHRKPGRQADPVELKDDFLHQRRLRNDRFGSN